MDIASLSAGPPTPVDRPDTAASIEAAAHQFERMFVQEFVNTFTKEIFDAPFSSTDGAGWLKTQTGMHREALTGVLTDHLVASGALKLGDLLAEQLKERAGLDNPDAPAETEDPAPVGTLAPTQTPHALRAHVDATQIAR